MNEGAAGIRSLAAAVPLAAATCAAAYFGGNLVAGESGGLAFLRWVGPGTVVINSLAVLAFWVAIVDLARRNRRTAWETAAFRHKLLPEDVETIVDREHIPKILRRLNEVPAEDRGARLCQAVELCASKYQVSSSVEEVASAARMYLENEADRAEGGYSMVRYLAWAIPSIGFIGTVMGLSTALGRFGQGTPAPAAPDSPGGADLLMKAVSTDLMLAFNTTFTALVLAVILMYYVHTVQAREAGLFNRISEHCLKYFVAKAWYPPSGRT